jgi:hypothetical protein
LKVWTKEEALVTLRGLADEAEQLRTSKLFSAKHTMWIMKCLDTLQEVFGSESRYYLSFARIDWNTLPSPIDTWEYGGNLQAAIEAKHHEYFLNYLESSKGFLLGAADYLEERELSDVYIAINKGNEASLVLKVLNLAEQKLRKVIRDRPSKERQVQDSFESLLVGADIPYGREIDSIEYSSKTYIPDFSLAELNLAVEIKLCSREEREKELPAEINDDILAYKTKYQNLIFVVYDLGIIRDKERFCGSFENYENVMVRVVKH